MTAYNTFDASDREWLKQVAQGAAYHTELGAARAQRIVNRIAELEADLQTYDHWLDVEIDEHIAAEATIERVKARVKSYKEELSWNNGAFYVLKQVVEELETDLDATRKTVEGE